MTGRGLAVIAALSLVPVAARADAPLAPAPAVTCSAEGHACVAHDPGGRSATVWRKGPRGAKVASWRVAVGSPRLIVADDGRSLVELYPGLNLLDPGADGNTVVLVFHRPGARGVPVRLREVVGNVAHLPATASHRQWARAYGFEGNRSFLLLTAEGRSLRFDPATGRQR